MINFIKKNTFNIKKTKILKICNKFRIQYIEFFSIINLYNNYNKEELSCYQTET